MPSMSSPQGIRQILDQIQHSIGLIQVRSASITDAEYFVSSDYGLVVLDSICMQLIAIGESIKSLDKATEGKLLTQFPDIPWSSITGMRDVLSHHYYHTDAEIIFDTCKVSIPKLGQVISAMYAMLGK